jgi:hypothetical protein
MFSESVFSEFLINFSLKIFTVASFPSDFVLTVF